MSDQQESSQPSSSDRKPVVVDDTYLADIAKRLRKLRSLASEEATRFS